MESVTIRGKYFYQGDRRFLINGVCYQFSNSEPVKIDPTVLTDQEKGGEREPDSAPKKRKKSIPQDVLAGENVDDLKRSLVRFRELELNCLYVYWIDPDKDHDEAMDLLAEAGIYVLVCVHDISHAINRLNPLESYNNTENLQHCFRVVDVMSRYSNTLGLFVANSVVNTATNTKGGPEVIRAVCRDLKRYMQLRATVAGDGECDGNGKDGKGGRRAGRRCRVLPLGYSAPDNAMYRRLMFDYTVAGPVEEGLDFFAMNCYSWVGESSIRVSGYENLEQRFADTPIPVFFSEYGAKVYDERIFAEAPALYDPRMTKTFSGGCVYQFFQMANNYGLVERKLPSSEEDYNDKKEGGTNAEDGKHDAKEEKAPSEGDGKSGSEQQTWIPLKDYENLRTRLASCRELRNPMAETETSEGEALQRPAMPQRNESRWLASTTIPDSPLDWDQVSVQIKEEKGDEEGWLDVAGLVRELGKHHI